VEITYQGLFDTSLIKSMGIHVVKSERRGMEDIRYDDPYTTTKVCPWNFFITFLPFFFRSFLVLLILFISLMAYPTQVWQLSLGLYCIKYVWNQLTLLIHLDFVNLSSPCVFNHSGFSFFLTTTKKCLISN